MGKEAHVRHEAGGSRCAKCRNANQMRVTRASNIAQCDPEFRWPSTCRRRAERPRRIAGSRKLLKERSSRWIPNWSDDPKWPGGQEPDFAVIGEANSRNVAKLAASALRRQIRDIWPSSASTSRPRGNLLPKSFRAAGRGYRRAGAGAIGGRSTTTSGDFFVRHSARPGRESAEVDGRQDKTAEDRCARAMECSQ